MKIERGSVWHTYTMESPSYKNAEKLANRLISSGLFLSILTPNNIFHYLNNDKPKKSRTNFSYENNRNAVSVSGLELIHEKGVCEATKYCTLQTINLRLSQSKLLYPNDDFYSNGLICFLKPFVIKKNDDSILLIPLVRLFGNGFSHVTFIDIEQYSEELDLFIKNRVNLPLSPCKSITSSVEYAVLSCDLDLSKYNLILRTLLKSKMKEKIKGLHESSEPLSINDTPISGMYVDYAKILDIDHNLSDLARYIIAIIYALNNERKTKGLFKGRDISHYFSGWQGKPNIFIFEHENQKNKSHENETENKDLVSSLLAKNHAFYSNTKGKFKKYRDYRAFDDFNYFSEQSVSLTLLSKDAAAPDSFNDTYTETNLILDNQIKSDLRSLISFFYESKIEKIRNETNHLGLAKVQEEIIFFEEWLRLASKSYGEIQDYALDIFKSTDIVQARSNVNDLLKARIQLFKLEDAKASEKSNKILTIAFGLIASTSLSPIIAKPIFKSLGLTKASGFKIPENYEETIYFFTTAIFVSIVILILNRISKL
ncbi:hypothetical protein [Serratia ureilytica]|uniref:hypothetical protein n=1 Tax=Serratia ureilytica TaxID=300181 RepID=UPI00313E32A0